MGDINLDLSKAKRFRLFTLSSAIIGLGAGAALMTMGSPLLMAGAAAAAGLALPTVAVAAAGIATTFAKTGIALVKACSPQRIKRRKRIHRSSFIAQHALLQIPAVAAKTFAKEIKFWAAATMIIGYSSLKSLIPSGLSGKKNNTSEIEQPPAAPLQNNKKPTKKAPKLRSIFQQKPNAPQKETHQTPSKTSTNQKPKAP